MYYPKYFHCIRNAAERYALDVCNKTAEEVKMFKINILILIVFFIPHFSHANGSVDDLVMGGVSEVVDLPYGNFGIKIYKPAFMTDEAWMKFQDTVQTSLTFSSVNSIQAREMLNALGDAPTTYSSLGEYSIAIVPLEYIKGNGANEPGVRGINIPEIDNQATLRRWTWGDTPLRGSGTTSVVGVSKKLGEFRDMLPILTHELSHAHAVSEGNMIQPQDIKLPEGIDIGMYLEEIVNVWGGAGEFPALPGRSYSEIGILNEINNTIISMNNAIDPINIRNDYGGQTLNEMIQTLLEKSSRSFTRWYNSLDDSDQSLVSNLLGC